MRRRVRSETRPAGSAAGDPVRPYSPRSPMSPPEAPGAPPPYRLRRALRVPGPDRSLVALQAPLYPGVHDAEGRAMASITIRKLDDDVKTRLRVRAAQNGRSME